MSVKNELYKNIVDKLPEGVLVTDFQDRIIYANKKFLKNSGYNEQEILDENIYEIIQKTKNSCPSCEMKLKDPDSVSEEANYELGELKQKDGKLNCIRINHIVTADDNIIYTVIPLSEVAFLNQAHIDFVSTVSHELRTPLTSIKGFADTLLNSGPQLSSEQQTRFVSIIKSQVDRLTRLVENLLTVSKLEAKQSKSIFKAVDFPKMLESILYGIQPKAKEHNIEVEIISAMPHLWVDSDKFEQVMTNLIDNAVKYSSAGTTVRIKAGFVAGNCDMAEIKVIDQGVGIPEEHLSKIFTKFSRIDNPLTRGVQGTGLGLYITKTLVEGMNGQIFVESDENGSTFIVQLPVATPEVQALQKFQESH